LAEKPAKLVRIAVSGGVPEQVATATYEPFDCARDVSTGDVYWVTRNPNWPFSGWVNHTASSVMTTEPLSPSQAKVSHVGIDEQFAYWAYVDGVHRFRRDGSGVIESVALGVATGDFVVGQKAVFIADRLSGRIYRRDK
jgi:hypothetical protein